MATLDTATATKSALKFSRAEVSEHLRPRIKGYLLCMVDPGAAASVGEMSVKLGVPSDMLGTVCRDLAASGEIGFTGNARGRKYFAIIS